MAVWLRSVYKHVWERNNSYRTHNHSGRYETVVHSKTELKAYFQQKGWKLVVERHRRTTADEFLAMFAIYLTWRADFYWEPAEYTIHHGIRIARPELPVLALCVYALGIEGKEGPFWESLLAAYDSLSARTKMRLTTLVSDVDAEFMAAAEIMYGIHQKAITSQATKKVKEARSWWTREAHNNVSQHMGWVGKEVSENVLHKIEDGSLQLGDMGHHYEFFVGLSRKVALKYRIYTVASDSNNPP